MVSHYSNEGEVLDPKDVFSECYSCWITHTGGRQPVASKPFDVRGMSCTHFWHGESGGRDKNGWQGLNKDCYQVFALDLDGEGISVFLRRRQDFVKWQATNSFQPEILNYAWLEPITPAAIMRLTLRW